MVIFLRNLSPIKSQTSQHSLLQPSLTASTNITQMMVTLPCRSDIRDCFLFTLKGPKD